MSNTNDYDKAYDEGYKAGKNDDLVGQFSQSLTKGYSIGDIRITESYNAGYEDGQLDYHDENNSNYRGKNQHLIGGRDYNKQRRETEEHHQAQRQVPQQARDSSEPDDDSGNCLGKLIVYGILAFVLIWFVFSVAIPLIIINIASIALMGGMIKKTLRKYLFPISVLGAIYIVFDYNLGWVTSSLVSGLSFFESFIPIFFYLNIIAGLVSAYFVIRNQLNEKRPQVSANGESTKRNSMIMVSLFFIGCLTIGLQTYFDHRPVNSIVVRSPNPPSSQQTIPPENNFSNAQNETPNRSIEEKTIVEPALPGNATVVTTDFLALKEYPDINSTRILKILNDEEVLIVSKTSTCETLEDKFDCWYEVKYNGLEGYVFGGYLKFQNNPDALPQSSTTPYNQNDTGIEKMYKGNVGKLEAIYNLKWSADGSINGTYYYPQRSQIIYTLKGKDLKNGKIQLDEYTGDNITANCLLTLQAKCYIGEMNNTDGRIIKMTICE